MAFTKTPFQPGNKLPASKLNEIQDAIVEHEGSIIKSNIQLNKLQESVNTLNGQVGKSIKSVNGKAPDENGNIEIEAGGVTEEDLKKFFPKTTNLDFSNWLNGSFTETLEDGTTVTHDVLYDGSGNVIGIGDITISGVN